MPHYPHDRPHIFLDGRAVSEAYSGRGGSRRNPLPSRNRQEHARRLAAELNQALAAAGQAAAVHVQRSPHDMPGYYLDFVISPLGQEFIQSLENRQQGIELLSVTRREPNEIHAAVFVPMGAEKFFRKRIEAYRTEETAKGKPKNEKLVASIDSVSLAVVRSIFTDDPGSFPAEDIPVWWEAWLRNDTYARFMHAANEAGVRVRLAERLTFPEREVVLANANVTSIANLLITTNAIAELRLPSDTPAVFLGFRNFEQADWARGLAARIRAPGPDAPCCMHSRQWNLTYAPASYRVTSAGRHPCLRSGMGNW
jgi:hypothetical protein